MRSLKISAVAKGEEDQMMRTRGKVRVRRTSLDWMDCDADDAVSERGSAFFLEGYLFDFA